jgi:hypothetical protein
MFDVANAKDQYSALPAGNYSAYVDEAEFKISKTGSEYLSIVWEIFGDKYKGKKIFENYNLLHDKEQVRNIALASMKKMMLASGFKIEALKFESKEALVKMVLQCRVQLKLAVKEEAYSLFPIVSISASSIF